VAQETTRLQQLEGLGLVQAGSLTNDEVAALNNLNDGEFTQLRNIGQKLKERQQTLRGLDAAPSASFRPWFI
jgi:hypothetical protein